jgi:transcriptional antiterminator RfaH
MATIQKEPMHHVHATIERWFAIHTRFKCEKYVLDQLEKKGIQAYVPLRKKVRLYGKRKRYTSLPVISCYAFVKIVEKQYQQVLETEYVMAFVKSAKAIKSIPEEEMINLKRIVMDETLEYTVEPQTMQIGTPVMVTAGTLAGMKGKLVRMEGKDKFIVDLETMGHSILITIDAKYLAQSG